MKSFKNFSDLHEKAKKNVYANPDWKGQSGLEALGSVVKNTLTGRGAAGIKDDDRKARERAAKNYSGQSGLQGITSVLKNTLTGRGAAGIRQDAEEHRRRNDPSYVPKSKKPKTDEKPKTNEKPKQLTPPDKDPKHRFWSSSPTMNPKTGKKPPGGDTPPTTAPKQPRTAKEKAYGSKSTLSKDKQAINKEYDRLRNSKDPKERAKAADFGKKNSPLPGPKSPNPLMKRFGDRDARKKELAKIRRDAKDASISQSPNAEKIKKKETAIRDNIKSSMKRQALGDRAKAKQGLDTSKPTPKDQLPKGAQQARTGVPKTDTPAVKKPPAVVPANTGSGRTGGFGSGTYGKGMPSNPPVKRIPVTPFPSSKPGTPIKLSQGGEVKKKTKKESFLGFSDYLAEKKTKIKLNPKKDDILEGGCGSYSKGGDVKKNHGEDCDCMKCEKKRRKDDLGDEKTVSTEGYAYVSQEEVSEESYQEGNQTETDLTEASFEIGPGHRGAMRGKKIYDKGKGTTNPHEKDAFLKRTGPQLPLAKGKKSLETAGYEPETEGEQLDEFMGGIIKGMKGPLGKIARQGIKPGGNNPLGIKNKDTSAGGGLTFTNNARLLARAPAQYTRGVVPTPDKPAAAAAKPAGPKPNPMQANRPGSINTSNAGKSTSGGSSDAMAIAQAKLKNKTKTKVSNLGKDGLQKMPESRRLKSFGAVAAMNEEQLDEFLGGLGSIAKRIFGGGSQKASSKGSSGSSQSPLASITTGGSALKNMTGGSGGAFSAASNVVKNMTAKPLKGSDSNVVDTKDTKAAMDSKRKKREGDRLKGMKASMEEAINQVYEGREEDAKKSLDNVKKRQGVLDDYEKKTGKKLDISKTPEHKAHKQNFPGAKRTGKKKRGAKETELETHNRRVNKYSERLRKYGKTKKQKEYDDGMAKHASRFD